MGGSNRDSGGVGSSSGGNSMFVKLLIILLFIQAYTYDMLQNSIWRHINKLHSQQYEACILFNLSLFLSLFCCLRALYLCPVEYQTRWEQNSIYTHSHYREQALIIIIRETCKWHFSIISRVWKESNERLMYFISNRFQLNHILATEFNSLD